MIEAAIICHYLSGELTPQEKRKVERWCMSDPKNREELDLLKIIWQLSSMYGEKIDISFDTRQGWLNLKKALSEKKYESDDECKNKHINSLPSASESSSSTKIDL